MLFNSWQYGLFLPVVFALHWLIHDKYRWIFLLAASYFFYMSWNAKYIFLILFTTIASYVSALVIEASESRREKKAALCATLVVCLGILIIFKYLDFLFSTVSDFFALFAITLHPVTLRLMLPVGISFYTFQTLSYVLDVYNGSIKAERHFGYYATFVAFFPQLVAGPIERPGNLLPQIKRKRVFDYEQGTYGMKLMTWGFFKKMVIADILAPYADQIFSAPERAEGFSIVIAILAFTLQIYCDFSGYSDIAIGTAKLFGIDLMKNFDSPYFSGSIREFWSRWHISLSTWFRDYVYIPLGGSRKGKLRHYGNLMATFLISGLWHGANWTFVIWGGFHGILQVLEAQFLGKKGRTSASDVGSPRWILKVIFVFLLCAVGWTFFRAERVSDAFLLFWKLPAGIESPLRYLKSGFQRVGIDREKLYSLMISIGILSAFDICSLRFDVIETISHQKKLVRYFFYFSIVTAILILHSVTDAAFVYFQF